MGNANSNKHIDEKVKDDFENNDKESAAAKIKEHLDELENVPLNIAITGQTGSGKSSFINAIRGIGNNEEGAAPVGVKETTVEVTEYLHPNFPNVKLYDLPGVGTPKFPAAKYLELVKFEKYDFFIIISAVRFIENDLNLAKEIQKMKKKFYFVRSKIDQDMRNAKADLKDFNEEEVLKTIRDDCITGIQEVSLESPQVFLVSSRELHLYDFPLLQETLERELPDHKKEAFLLAMPNISLEMINKKKKTFKNKTKYIATLSATVAGVPVPGLSVAVDLSLLAGVITKYVFGFGLDIQSLKTMANYSGVSYEDLKAVIKSSLAGTEITLDLVLNVVSQIGKTAMILAAEGSKFIPIIGIPVSMCLSFGFTYKCLKIILDMLAGDAETVFQKVILERPQGHNGLSDNANTG